MIGLSMSLCLKDIAAGKVSKESVTRIISGTHAETPEQIEELFQGYMVSYWSRFPEEQMRPLYEWACSIMEQPRVTGGPVPCIGSGHWVESEDDIIWC